MITKTHSITTKEVTKEQLWKLISNVNNWNSWDTSVEYSELHGEFKTGTFFTLKPAGGPNVRIQLVDVQPQIYFKDCTTFPFAKMYGEHTYAETPEGLQLTVTMTMTGPFGWAWNHIVMRDIVKNLPNDLKQQVDAAKHL